MAINTNPAPGQSGVPQGSGGFLPPGVDFSNSGLPAYGSIPRQNPRGPNYLPVYGPAVGSVQGGQFQSPGSNGVTSYGLFSRAQPGRSVLPPPQAPAQPGINAPSFQPGFQPSFPGQGQVPSQSTPRFNVPGINPPPTSFQPPQVPFQPPTNSVGSIDRGRTAPMPQFPQLPTPSLPPSLAQRGLAQRGAGRFNFAQGQQDGVPQRTMADSTPAPSMQLDMSNANNGGQNQVQAQTRNNPYAGDPIPDPTKDPEGFVRWLSNTFPGNNLANTAVENASESGTIPGAIGATLGQGFADFTNAWNDATGGGSGASFFDFLNGQIPGFQQSSLMGDVGQNMTSMMDPAAWEQMAQNRLGAANEANLQGLNVAERRLADLQGRTGLSNLGGIQGQMYTDFANRGIQNQRDIFNDTLGNQMQAIGQAGNFALGQNAQDQQRWSQLLGLAGMGAQADYNANRQDNPSGAAMLQDIFAGLGGLAGAGLQAGGGMLGMLPGLLMMGA